MNATERSISAELRNDIYVVASNWFVNRCPLVTRVPRVPCGSTAFTMVMRKERIQGHAQPASYIMQFCQTFTVASRVPALGDDDRKEPRAPFGKTKMDSMQHLMDWMEASSYYGKGEDPAISGRPKQKGLRTLLETNNEWSPVGGLAYTAKDLIRDTLNRCRAGGGDPDVLLISTNFKDAFDLWGCPLQRIDAGVNIFGQPIDAWETAILPGVSVIEAPLLRPFTAVCLTSSEVRMRMKRNEFWNPRGARGDAHDGEWVAEGAIEIDDDSHHAWVEGIEAFSA
jgi:hypothetical protein